MRGTGRRAPRLRAVAAGVLLASSASAVWAGALVAPAAADTQPVPGTMTTAAQNTSSFSVPVAAGTTPSAITAVLTQPEVVDGGQVVFTVNGRLGLTVPSTLYLKVSIPVTAADVIADGTIRLTVATQGPAAAGATCYPAGGTAAVRKLAVEYTGVETAPTSVGAFFPTVSSGVTVQIPADADDATITAGLTAVAALATRYDGPTPITLVTQTPEASAVVATQRLVVLTPGRAGEVVPTLSATNGVPTLTLTGTGDDLVNAARALSTETFGLSGTGAQNPSQQNKPRSKETERTLDQLGTGAVALSGYGSVTQRLEVPQDAFGQPIDAMKVHLEGSHTAFTEGGGARLDVRANGDLVGSTTLGQESTFSLDLTVPSSKLRSVNDLDLTLTALAPDGSACTPASVPPAEVDVDTGASSITVSPGTGDTQGFQLFPQIFEGTLPVALKPLQDREVAGVAVNAAALIATLQRAAGSQLDVQLMDPEAFLADDRSGLFIGARPSDAEALDAPLKLGATRVLESEDATYEETSEDPYAVLESIDRNDRLVLMLGSWAPGDAAAKGTLARKVVDYAVNQGWDALDGDLVIADDANPAFAAASKSLAPHQEVVEEKSYAKWFIAVIAVLLLLLALQVVVAIRRDRAVARADDDAPLDGPAYVEDDDDPELDDLGDVDDLDVLEHTAAREPYAPAPVPDAEPEDEPEDEPDDDEDDDLDDELDGFAEEEDDDDLEPIEESDVAEEEPDDEPPPPPTKPSGPTRPPKPPIKKRR